MLDMVRMRVGVGARVRVRVRVTVTVMESCRRAGEGRQVRVIENDDMQTLSVT